VGVSSGPHKKLIKDHPPHYMEGKEEELSEKVIFRHKHLTGSVKADIIPSSVSTLRIQNLSEAVCSCPEFLVCPVSSSRDLTCAVLDGCCTSCVREELGNLLVSSMFVQQTSTFPLQRVLERGRILIVSKHRTRWGCAGRREEETPAPHQQHLSRNQTLPNSRSGPRSAHGCHLCLTTKEG